MLDTGRQSTTNGRTKPICHPQGPLPKFGCGADHKRQREEGALERDYGRPGASESPLWTPLSALH
jgi:hypothetical protein